MLFSTREMLNLEVELILGNEASQNDIFCGGLYQPRLSIMEMLGNKSKNYPRAGVISGEHNRQIYTYVYVTTGI